MKKKIILTSLIIIACGTILIIMLGFYPVAVVNWRVITIKDFKKDLAVANYFYKTTLDENLNPDSPEIKKRIKREVLDKLIEDILINKELKLQLKNSELEEILKNKTDELTKQEGIEKEIKILYGLSLEDFKEQVSRPILKREILAGRFLINNKDFIGWMKEQKNQAKVMIFFPDLIWKEGGVVIK